jgi:hypothetical protein
MFVDALVFVGLMSLLATLGTVTIVFIKRHQYKSAQPSIPLDRIAQQLASLQETVEATAIEVERIAEGQRFTTKLLADRSQLPVAPQVGGRANTPH